MALGSTTWLQAVPVVALAALLLVVPGALGARLTGLRWATSLGVGPLLGTTVIVGGGIVAALLGIPWGVGPLAASLAVVIAACAVVGFVLRSRPEPTLGDHGDGSPWSLLVGLALALLVSILVVVPETASPTAFPQSPDTIYHLGTIQWMLEGSTISSLDAGGFASLTGTGFYPAAFHGVAATVALLTGATPVVAASSVALALAGVVWPLGLLVVARRVLGSGWSTTVCAALASVAFAAFPFWLMGYGVLWPNLYGQALLPAALALLLAVVDGPVRARSLLVGLAALPGVAVAHPNAFISFVLIGTLVVVAALLRRGWSLRSTRRLASAGSVLAAVLVLGGLAAVWVPATLLSAGMRESNPSGPEMTVGEGVVDVVFLAPRELLPLWVAGGVVLAGLVVLVARRRHLWVVLAHLGVTALYLAITLLDNEVTRFLTWPWYNNSPRLGALMVLTAALLATAALTAAAAWLRDRLDERLGDRQGASGAASSGRGLGRRAPAVAATTVVALAFAAATAGVDIGASRHSLREYFSPPPEESWASESDLVALKALGAKVPPGAVVAANPWRGGSYLYLTSDRRMLFPTEKAWAPGDRELLGADLDRAAKDPEVCAAARRQNVQYVLVGGSSMTDSRAQERRYAGVDHVGNAHSGFSLVDRAGDYALYRLDACG